MIVIGLLISAGCGGGGGSSINPAPNPNPTLSPTNTPGGGTSQGKVLNGSGYVYTGSTSRVADARVSQNQVVILPTNTNPPTGFIPGVNFLVRSTKNPNLVQKTDSSGYFGFDPNVFDPNFLGDINQIDLLVEDPNALAPPVAVPVLAEPVNSSQLTDLKIVPPYSSETTGWTMRAGDFELFCVIGKSGNKWHPVSDPIIWSVSDEALGNFLWNNGFFLSSNTLTSAKKGQITAQFSGKTLSMELNVVTSEGVGTVEGYVKDLNQNPITYAIIEAEPSSLSDHSSYGLEIADENGYYKITDLPYGTYNLKVSDLYNNTLKETSVLVNGAITQNFTISSSVPSSIIGTIKTDKFRYKPGDIISVQANLFNPGINSISFQYSSIKFELVKKDFFAGTETVVDSVTASAGTAQIPSVSHILIPSSGLNLTIPSNAKTSDYYAVTATISSSQTINIEEGFIILEGSTPTPVPFGTPTPVPSVYPTLGPTVTPGPSGNDYYLLGQIKFKLNDIYYQLYDLSSQAYNGEDVSGEVNENSYVQADIKYVRNSLLPYLTSVGYSSWQGQLDNVIYDLNQYAYYNGGYTALNNAYYKVSSISTQVADAQSSLPAAAYMKKLKRL